MTNKLVETVPITSIIIDRANRQRTEEIEYDPEFALSIQKVGLLHFPVVTRDLKLVAGERRIFHCKQLGWDRIPVTFIDTLDQSTIYLAELEENVRRKNLEWQDEVRAVDEYHRLKLSIDPQWTREKTAAAVGQTVRTVARTLAVAKELENPEIKAVPNFSTASNIVARKTARAVTAGKLDIAEKIGKTVEIPLLNADFTEWAKTYSGPKFNFIHCDFPYGVNADKHNQGAAKSFGGYEDSPDIYWNLLAALHAAMNNVVAESAHLMFWFSMDYYETTKTLLTDMGWQVNPFPLIWFKSDNSGILPDPQRGPRRLYETAFLASRGDRLIVRSTGNLVASPNTKEIHMSEKPRDMLRHFFKMLVDESSYVLDPTCGSANAIHVAKEFGAVHVLGLEKSEEFFNRAKETFYE